ncbi:hypothetical protein NLZ15_22740 (plasmid) [Atlantibacter subterranea]|uniref:hypothetical protein n=1 Tax=Atlantibacter subterraneus TaxID=255519 RepID=UPI0020C53FE4|nr:hypothetical protein [Atlantibacter subterranea]UTJ49793.1 hypothetical protein NLZ15_22740 [Atlantibacter subterranea]
MATPANERQALCRQRQRARGFRRLTTTLDGSTSETLSKLAEQHGQTKAQVIRLGILLADRALAGKGE